MFYEHIILAKKGPLARIWLAAHWDKKITKAHVFETNIEKSVEGILQPKVKLALRTSGHLLLGVVRIYSRKAKYLLADCNEAFVKIKMAFRPGMVDLPEGHREANVNAITLPEVFHDFDTALPELNDIDIEAQFSINQSRADEITMREDYGSLSLSLNDDGFGDVGFEADTPDVMRGTLASNINDQLFEDEILEVNEETETNLRLHEGELVNTPLDGDGFGDAFGQPELFEDDLFGEPQAMNNVDKEDNVAKPLEDSENEGVDNFNDGASSVSSCPNSVNGDTNEVFRCDDNHINEELSRSEQNVLEQSTFQNEDEGFALAPIDASAYKGITKSKRKRKLIVDEIKNISGEEMKAQLADTSDIITTLDLAPPTKRLMYWKETGGVEKLFGLPSRTISARILFMNYSRHLLSHSTPLEDFSNVAPSEILALEQYQNENENPVVFNNKRGRKRKSELQTICQVESFSQSLPCPEPIREQENSAALPHVSLDIAGQEQDSVISHGGVLFSEENVNDIVQVSNFNDLAMTPRNAHHTDSADDYHGDLTPVGLDHGHLTPHHSGIEEIESIPNLPPDQVSSIINEAESMHDNEAVSINRSCDITTDWNEYDFPHLIGVQNASDEQMENETDEQFEERVLNKRAAQMFYVVRSCFAKQDHLTLSQLTMKNTRKQAAQKFYSLLVLKKFKALSIIQHSPYADITITRGPMFENPKL